jgi:hypothetical protein
VLKGGTRRGHGNMGAPSAGLEVMETSGGYGGLGRLWRFDGLPPSNLEVEGKMM